MSDHWSVKAWYRVPLYPFMWQRVLGVKRGKYVYIALDGETCIYVGQTQGKLHDRLWKHAYSGSAFGLWMVENEKRIADILCSVIVVSGNLDSAERYHISRFNPQLNQIIYKNHLTIPPVKSVDMQNIDIDHYMRMPLTGMATPTMPQALSNPIEESDDIAMWDRIYTKAWRDPNNPKSSTPILK